MERRLAVLAAIALGAWLIIPAFQDGVRDFPRLSPSGVIDLIVGVALVVFGLRSRNPTPRPAPQAGSSAFPDTVLDGDRESERRLSAEQGASSSGLERWLVFHFKYLLALPAGLAVVCWGSAVLLGCTMSGVTVDFHGCAPGGSFLAHVALWSAIFLLVTIGLMVPALILLVLKLVATSSTRSR